MSSIQRYTPAGGSAYVFSNTGRPRYSESATFEGASERHGQPRRKITRHGITQWFKEGTFADNQARYAALKAALAVAEGVFYFADEDGNVRVNRRVRVLTHSLPEQWGQHMAEVKIEFESVEELAATEGATFTATGETAVSLGDVRDWKEKIATDRFSELVPNRRESRLAISASGSIRANPADTVTARRATLQAAALALRGLKAKDGVLAFGAGFSERVRVQECLADLGDATDELRWSLTASLTTFPAGGFDAEANWTVAAADDTANSERTTRVAGTIRAPDEAAALAKRDVILATWTDAARLYKGGEWHAAFVEGEDGATDLHAWEFSLAFREVLPGAVVSYTLKVSDKLDAATGLLTTTYAGRVTAASAAAALAAARSLGKNKHPMKISEDEEQDTVSLAGSTAQHVQVAFAYAYRRRGTEQHAEVSSETQRDTFGACMQTVSGYAVAGTIAEAQALARSFKVTGALILSEREGDAQEYHLTTIPAAWSSAVTYDPDGLAKCMDRGRLWNALFVSLNSRPPSAAWEEATPQLFHKVPFTYTYRLAAITGSLEYSVGTEDLFDSREVLTTYEGVARAADSATADALINTLVGGLTGRWVTNKRLSHHLQGNAGVFDYRSFTIARAGALSNGEDILEAEVTITTVASHAMAKFTPIPFGSPHVQSNVGSTTGTVTASGSITAISLATAKTWARSWIPSGYKTQPNQESVTSKFRPRSGSSVACYRLQFTYPTEAASVALA